MVDLLAESFNKHKITNIHIHGKNCKSSDHRSEVVNTFNSDKNIRALITSDILREGMNVTSANYVINFDILWNPAKTEQRVGRIDRIGNKHQVINIINFIAENTIEERVYNLQNAKKNLAIDVLDSGKTEIRMTS